MNNKKRISPFLLTCCAILIALPALVMYRTARQKRLNRELITTIYNKDLAASRSLLQQGADPNTRDRSGLTPLMIVLDNQRVFVPKAYLVSVTVAEPFDMVQTLIQYGANANVLDRHGDPLTFTATEAGYTRTLRLLLEHGVDPNAHKGGALYFAILSGDPATVQVLLDRHVRLDSPGPANLTPLQYASTCNAPKIAHLLKQAGSK